MLYYSRHCGLRFDMQCPLSLINYIFKLGIGVNPPRSKVIQSSNQ